MATTKVYTQRLGLKRKLSDTGDERDRIRADVRLAGRPGVEDLFAPLHDGTVNLDAFAPTFIHGDLASYHILCDPKRQQLAGVLDFGTAGPGDVATDFACIIIVYGESFLRRLEGYYPVASDTLEHARFLAGFLELEWALAGVASSDISTLLVHIGRARDRCLCDHEATLSGRATTARRRRSAITRGAERHEHSLSGP